MRYDLQSISQRIIEAARLAAAMHLQEAGANDETVRQEEAAGGAGPRFSTDGDLPLVGGRIARPPYAERRAG